MTMDNVNDRRMIVGYLNATANNPHYWNTYTDSTRIVYIEF